MTKEWYTDGVDVLLNGKRFTAEELRWPILNSIIEAAKAMPIRATNCYRMGTRRAEGTIRVTLVGSSYLEPVDVEAVLTTQKPISSLRDVLSGAPVEFDGHTAKLLIPAGAFRILDVKTGRLER